MQFQIESQNLDIKIVKVTPDLAKYWLDNTPPDEQRDVRAHKVKEYANEMLGGTFRGDISNDLIQISSKETVINGQHRLRAIVQTGLSQNCKVEFGVPPGAFKIADRGMIRNLADDLKTQGIYNGKNSKQRAAAINYIAKILHNNAGKNLKFDEVVSSGINSSYQNDMDYIEQFVKTLPAFIRNSGKFQGPQKAAFAIAHNKFPQETKEFIMRYSGLSSPIGIHDPPNVLGNSRGKIGNKKEVPLVTAFKTLNSLSLFIKRSEQKNASSPEKQSARHSLLNEFATPRFDKKDQ